MRLLALTAAALLCACSGPPAPDAALCEDVVIRLCHARSCPGLDAALEPGSDCRATVLERTGCADDAFTFVEPTRERFISCRLPLVSRSTSPDVAPTCNEVTQLQQSCPDVMQFLGGKGL
ncbi:hypothetical protein P2318_05525 [Myxococcaceae bacterium GXIMD 01537]